MSEAKTIQHKGYIEEISAEGVRVKFIAESACSACHAKGVCSAADMKDKEVFIPYAGPGFKTGDSVHIKMSASQGSRAVLLGYVYPFFFFLFFLLVFTATGVQELHAGLFSLAMLIPYYSAIYIFKNKINRNFNFSIDKVG